MVGILVVTHSARLAEGVAELAREMAGPEVALEAVGGLDEPGRPLGTDALQVLQALERVWSEDGVLVLMDLGSAVLSAEMALDMLPEERRDRVQLCEAPVVEGAVAAAVAARLGEPLSRVAGEARAGLAAKVAHLGGPGEAAAGRPEAPGDGSPAAGGLTLRLVLTNPLGLHARPAARLVRTAGRFDAAVELTNLSTGKGPARARSLSAVATLGVLQGHEVLVRASGPEASEALAALEELAARNWGDPPGVRASPAAGEPAPAAPARPETLPAGPPGAGDRLDGIPASPGIALGAARRLHPPDIRVPDHQAEDADAEWAVLAAALAGAGEEVRRGRAAVAARGLEDEAGILDALALLLEDEEIRGPARRAVFEERQNAARAWSEAVEAAIAGYLTLEDEYLRARADDLAGLARQVLALLLGAPPAPELGGPGILVVPDLTPAETASLDPALVRGIAAAYGGATSHSAVLARSLGIPAVVGLGAPVLGVPEGAELILDGGAGHVLIQPAAGTVARYRALSSAEGEAFRRASVRAREPARTRDGVRIEVAANIASPGDVPAALEAGADGVGLLRTEFLFLGRETLPGEDEQEAAYREVAEALGGRPLVVRILDVGGDKPLPYVPAAREANPFLGVRGIRLALARPELLSGQLRAILRVGADWPVAVMFPMVATVDEVRAAGAVLDGERARLEASGVRVPERIPTGIMVEVPSAALIAERLGPEVDFFSIGTNDLAQYTMAADRGNERLAALTDALHPAVLQLIGRVAEAGRAHGRWVGVCGEVAGDPVATPLLVGLGVTELSMSPRAIPAVKAAIRSLDSETARALAEEAVGLESAEAVRGLVAARRGLLADSIAGTRPAAGP